MKQMSFAEINDLENGQQIPSFQGTVKKVFDQKTDVGQYGQWWLQNLILQDDHANEITVTWCCEDAFDAGCEGQLLHFQAGRDKKDQIAGIKREIRNKNGKKYESVKVDDRAKVTFTEKAANLPKQRDGGGENNATQYGSSNIPVEDQPTMPPALDPDWPEAEQRDKPQALVGEHYPCKPKSMLDERQRAIIRQHSQSMALEVLKLKVELKELTVEDLTPAKLRQLADYFDTDCLEAASK